MLVHRTHRVQANERRVMLHVKTAAFLVKDRTYCLTLRLLRRLYVVLDVI